MADQNLPTTGQNVKLELLVNGFPQKLVDSVVSFRESPRYDTIETAHLGTNVVDIEKLPKGWEGEIEVSRKSRQLDDFLDAYNLARRNRVPVLIIISTTKYFNDGTSVSHVYPDCKVDAATSGSRGQNVTTRLTWVCGQDRI